MPLLCATCQRPEAWRCPRCGRTLCVFHAPDTDAPTAMCEACEGTYAQRVLPSRRRMAALASAVVGLVCIAALAMSGSAGLRAVRLLLIVTSPIVLAILGGYWLRRRRDFIDGE